MMSLIQIVVKLGQSASKLQHVYWGFSAKSSIFLQKEVGFLLVLDFSFSPPFHFMTPFAN